MGNTPERNYPYPEYATANNAPAQIQSFATAVDTDILSFLQQPRQAANAYPSARVWRAVGNQAIANNTSVTLTYTAETFDNNSFFDIGVSTTNVVVNTAGVYLIGCSVTMQADGSATGAAALILMSSGALVQNPIGTSRDLHATRDTSLSGTTLHRVITTPETLTMFVRHNHGAGLNAAFAQMSVTRIA